MNICVVLVGIQIAIAQNVTQNGGKSYFFKMGKNSNEFRVNNRIMYLNHNITDLEYPVVTERKRVYQAPEKIPSKLDFTYYLDQEWNYNHSKINFNKTYLPMFVKKFYEETTDSTTTITRLLFNTNKNNANPILKFNLDNLSADDTILDADLYFYWPLRNNSHIFRESVVLRLYQFEEQFNENLNITHLEQNPDVHKLFNIIYVSKAQKGWQMFKVKKPIDNWLNGEQNLGLVLTISSYDTNKLLEVFNDNNRGNFSTFIVAKIQNNDSLPHNNEIVTGKREDIFDSSSQCQQQIWTINFNKMGWDKFIILPEEFTAFDCVGKCLKPTERDTNHAKFLHIFQRRSACCVPTRYSPLPIMHFDKYGDIAIKNYDKVVVKSCGCR